MKTAVFTTILALGFVSACSDKPSAECQEMYEQASKISENFLGKMSKDDKKQALKDFEAKWADMSKDERKAATEECAKANAMFKPLKLD